MPRTRQLSACWFCILGAAGIYFPYFTLYLKENVGLTGTEVGAVFATVPLVGMFAQPYVFLTLKQLSKGE